MVWRLAGMVVDASLTTRGANWRSRRPRRRQRGGRAADRRMRRAASRWPRIAGDRRPRVACISWRRLIWGTRLYFRTMLKQWGKRYNGRMNSPTSPTMRRCMHSHSDVCIVGNGAIAKTTALAFAQAGQSVTLLSPVSPSVPTAAVKPVEASWDVRVYALNHTAHQLLSSPAPQTQSRVRRRAARCRTPWRSTRRSRRSRRAGRRWR